MLAAVFLIGGALEALDTRPSVFPVRKGKIMLTGEYSLNIRELNSPKGQPVWGAGRMYSRRKRELEGGLSKGCDRNNINIV